MKARWVQSCSVYSCLLCFLFRYGGRCSEQLPSVVWDPWNPLYVVIFILSYLFLGIYPASFTISTMHFFQSYSEEEWKYLQKKNIKKNI